MTDKTDSKEREAFEAWHLTQYPQHIARHGDTYKNAHVRCRWQAWQARASLAANAGSEPVATAAQSALETLERTHQSLARQLDLIAERAPGNFLDKRPVVSTLTMHQKRTEAAAVALRSAFDTHPSPPEGMAGGWISVEERLPPPFEEMIVHPRPDDYCCEAFCDTAGNWKWAEYEHNFGVHHRECQVEYWLMLPDVPAPPTSSADSRKGGRQ